MKLDESINKHEVLKDMVRKQVTEIDTEILSDLEEEVQDEMAEDLDFDSPEKPHKFKHDIDLPTERTVVTRYLDGTPRSYYGDSSWYCEDDTGFPLNFNFTSSDVVDLSSELCVPLVQFLKLLVYFKLPGKDPFGVSSSYGTAKHALHSLFHVCSLLKGAGYLYGTDSDYLDLSTIDVEWVRDELKKMIDKDEGLIVGELARGFGAWVCISGIVDLPLEYTARFTKKELWYGGLNNDITKYVASKTQPWETIYFDDLVRMFSVTKTYLDHYVEDILFIARQLSFAFRIKGRGSRAVPCPILTTEWTKNIAEAILKREYAVDPESGKPWFTPRLNNPNKRWRISLDKADLKRQIDEMVYVCIFQLFIWTAARKGEIHSLKVDALLIDGKPLSPDIDALEQVTNGSSFELTRVVTKTDKDYLGEKKTLPLTRTAAKSFAILVEIFRSGRRATGNNFLFPRGYLGHGDRLGTNFVKENIKPIAVGSIYRLFVFFCEFAGVKHYHPHRCRKTLATILINYDPKCIELIKDLLCHKDINMTREYLMSLPGVAEEARKMFVAQQSEKVIEFIVSATEGKFAGPAGDRASAAIIGNSGEFKGNRLTDTTTKLLDILVHQGNFIAVRTPTAWCLRFNSRVPWDAPCLPKPDKRLKGEILEPNYDKCIDLDCRFSGYIPSDLDQARGRRAWAAKMRFNAIPGPARAHFEGMVNYFDGIIDILENGRPEIVGLHLVDAAFAEIGANA